MSARDWDEIPYSDRFNPNLSWGYWLVAQGELDGLPPLTDHTGQRWPSVREYFWVSRLGMARIPRDDTRNEELEFMLATLVSLDRRVIHTEERALDLFGSWDLSRHYLTWLAGLKQLMPQTVAKPNAELSPRRPRGAADARIHPEPRRGAARDRAAHAQIVPRSSEHAGPG
ncbi:hypothetical protein [Novosphingopyxis sp. YJ-S2-01]|uniref:hypothetical protein n=1 Tax=Novosphingopyxis sp. YJ-S2-01 TaxID=2794021 RepID=UPI0018DCF72D|nr:hypothetical protein [Novosphingopyxis sp. YJ-S2-01]MBH9538184.1 hypothetical protein [Novosphingopyxis sp. YJ-S2-01]